MRAKCGLVTASSHKARKRGKPTQAARSLKLKRVAIPTVRLTIEGKAEDNSKYNMRGSERSTIGAWGLGKRQSPHSGPHCPALLRKAL
eukprot:1502001-Amphidinium_carterae.1